MPGYPIGGVQQSCSSKLSFHNYLVKHLRSSSSERQVVENLAILRGKFDTFNNTILILSTFVPSGTRWDSDVIQFRDEAHIDISKMIIDNKNKGPKEVKKEKKI
jgi:hypothetical protein